MKRRSRVRASSTETAARVDEIYDVMRMGLWTPGKSGPMYAKKWKIPLTRVEHYSAEAWRRLRSMVSDTEDLQPEVSAILFEALQRARTLYKFDSIAKLADVLSKVSGARAAEKHEYAHVVAQYDALDNKGKVEYFRNVIREAEEAIAAIETIEVKGELIQ